MNYNRNLIVTLRQTLDGLPVGEPIIFETGQETADWLPTRIKVNVNKKITSELDSATVTIYNTPLIEQLYLDENLLFDLQNRDWGVDVFAGYGDDLWTVFSGDLRDFSVGGQNLTDQTITLEADSGKNAAQKLRIKQKFEAGQTYREIVEACFEVMLEQSIEIDDRIIDPENKLDKELKKPKTKDDYIFNVLADICREFDFTWGISHRPEEFKPQKSYFIDKRAGVDLGEREAVGYQKISYETSLLSGLSFSKNGFSFVHLADPNLNVGAFVEVDVKPKINTPITFRGRVNSISMSLDNMGAFTYNVECYYSQGEFTLLPQRLNDGGEIL